MMREAMSRAAAAVLATVVGCIGSSHVWAQEPTHAHADHSARASSVTSPVEHQAFLAENRAAMDKMMADMHVAPTGDVDVDFVAMMIPHHRGAVDMAVTVLRYGKNEQIRRLAQEIIVEQQQEIAAMRLALGQPLPPSRPAPTQTGPAQASTGTLPTPPEHNRSPVSRRYAPNEPIGQQE